MMASRDYCVSFNYDEISNDEEIIANKNVEDNVSYNKHVDSSNKCYLLSSLSTPESEQTNATSHQVSSSVKEHSGILNPNNDNVSSPEISTQKQSKVTRKKEKRQRKRKNPNKCVKKKPAKKSQKLSVKTQHKKLPSLTISTIKPKMFVPVLKTDKLKKTPKGKLLSAIPKTSSTPTTQPSAKSILLSKMAEAVNNPKYTSNHTSTSASTSDYTEYPTRYHYPLLSEMISRPLSDTVSISPASRQTLSTVHVEPVNTPEPKTNVISKLEKEIKCECKFNKGQPCWLLFQEERLRVERLHHLTLNRESLDLVILAKIAANINREEKIKKYRGRDRQRCRVCYYHEGRQICRETFMFIHGICKGRLCALMQHYKQKGLSVRVHGNKANIPHHALSYSDSEKVLDFIREYANNHCFSSFGRKPGSKAPGGLLIMSPSQSKIYVHHKYKLWCSEHNHRAVSLRSFQNLWAKHLPYIIVLRGSNKTPVPEPGSQAALLGLEEETDLEDEGVQTQVTTGTSSAAPISGISRITSNLLKKAGGRQDNRGKYMHSGLNTQLSFDSIMDEKNRKKSKEIPKQKVESASCRPLVYGHKAFKHSQIFEGLQKVDSSVGGTLKSLKSTRKAYTNSFQLSLPHADLHHSDLHIPQPIFSSPIQDHTSIGMTFPSQSTAAQVMVTAKKDMAHSHNKMLTTTSSLQPTVHVSQASQLLDPYSLHCSDRFAPHIPGSHVFADQSQPVLLPNQGSDFSNMHHIDWQTWQS